MLLMCQKTKIAFPDNNTKALSKKKAVPRTLRFERKELSWHVLITRT